MIVRELREEDLPQVEALYREQGLDYQLPTRIACGRVIEDEGKIRMVALSRPTVEIYMLAERGWETPGMRREALERLHGAMHLELKRLGYTDAHAWLPPGMCRALGRRLMRWFGWTQPRWTDFVREL